MTYEALAPCPFCGGKAYLEVTFIGDLVGLCDECTSTWPVGDATTEAADARNTRPSNPLQAKNRARYLPVFCAGFSLGAATIHAMHGNWFGVASNFVAFSLIAIMVAGRSPRRAALATKDAPSKEQSE